MKALLLSHILILNTATLLIYWVQTQSIIKEVIFLILKLHFLAELQMLLFFSKFS